MSQQEKITIELEREQLEALLRGEIIIFGSNQDVPEPDPIIEIQVVKEMPILKILQEIIYRLVSTKKP